MIWDYSYCYSVLYIEFSTLFIFIGLFPFEVNNSLSAFFLI